MIKIEAIIRPQRLDEVKAALDDIGLIINDKKCMPPGHPQ